MRSGPAKVGALGALFVACLLAGCRGADGESPSGSIAQTTRPGLPSYEDPPEIDTLTLP